FGTADRVDAASFAVQAPARIVGGAARPASTDHQGYRVGADARVPVRRDGRPVREPGMTGEGTGFAVSVALALGIQRASRDGKDGNRSIAAKTGLLLFLVVGSALGLGLIMAPWFLPLFGARIPATGVGLIFLSMVVLAWRQYRLARHETVAAILMAGMIAILMSASLLLLPALEKQKPAPFVAEVIRNHSDPTATVTTCGFGEPSLNFYIGRGPITAIETDALPAWASAPGKGVLVITELKRKGQRCIDDSPAIDTLEIIPGFNYSQGKWVRVHILTRNKAP
ncbi:MAG: hypothetical protein WCO77_12850, partial [bacterium]